MAAPPHVGPHVSAGVVEEAAVYDLEAPSPHPDRSAAVELGLAARVPVHKGQVLNREPGVILVLAMGRGPHLRLVTGVHVQDAGCPTPRKGHQAAAIDDHVRVLVVEHLGRLRERNGSRLRTTIENNDPALGHGLHHRLPSAALRGAIPDNRLRVGDVLQAGLRRDGAVAVGPARWRPLCPVMVGVHVPAVVVCVENIVIGAPAVVATSPRKTGKQDQNTPGYHRLSHDRRNPFQVGSTPQ